jgi:hypothetical protein
MPRVAKRPVIGVFDYERETYEPLGRNACRARPAGADPDGICGRPVHEVVADIGLCRGHFDKLHEWHNELIGLECRLEAERQAREEFSWTAEMASWAAQGRQVVYYLLRADGLIKIGTTKNLPMRLANLQTEHGRLILLLTHCGDHKREHEMHQQFASDRVEGEWFRASVALVSWIILVRRKRINVRTRAPGTAPIRALPGMLQIASKAGAAELISAETCRLTVG